jgi:hypothetical protein
MTETIKISGERFTTQQKFLFQRRRKRKDRKKKTEIKLFCAVE